MTEKNAVNELNDKVLMVNGGSRFFKKLLIIVFFSCFFLSIPSGLYQYPKNLSFRPMVAGPFPIPTVNAILDPFPTPEGIKVHVDFWKKIFGVYTLNQIVVHDSRYLNVIYEVTDTSNPSDGDPERAARLKYKQLLEDMPWDKPEDMTPEQARIYALFKDIPELPRFKKQDAVHRIRTQRGHAESFKTALIRSGRYIGAIKQIFARYGLPEELAYLPLIESGFDPRIRSHAGAIGLWQFMRRTGKHYNLRIDNLVDERRDPFLSAYAAAKFLKYNYRVLKSWPLAITAYNHGAKGMKRAIKQINSRNIADIIREYDGRRFEFASMNFYAEFLAAIDISSRYAEYFGEIEIDKPLKLVRIKLPDFISADTLEKYSPLTESEIRALNPALSEAVFRPGNFIPKGYALYVPAERKNTFAFSYASIPDKLKYKYLPAKAKYRVRKGETLSEIAKAHNSTVKAFMKLNRIRNPKRIRVGQWLKVPGKYVSVNGNTIPKSEKGSTASVTKHRVRRGQTLIKIADIYNTSAKAIATFNSLKNPQQIRAGQLLKIPEG